MYHPIFGDLSSNEEKERKARIKAAKLKKMMEDLWKSNRVVNAKRIARYVEPMQLGSTWGYEKDIFGH